MRSAVTILTGNQHQSLQEGSQWETERESQLRETFYSRFFVSSCLQVLVWHLKICLSPFCPLFVVVCILSPICSCLCFVCLLWNTYKDCSKRKEWPWVGMVRQSCCKYLCYETEKHCISREREKINLSVITLEGVVHDQLKCRYFYIFLLYIKERKA